MMNQPFSEHQSQAQDNLLKDTNVGRDLTFAPVQNIIETQIIQSSLEVVTQRKLNKNSPYQGLKKFNFKDRDRFFGRDKLISRLFEAVNRSSLSLVLGASGSGKSSVVRAGLISELKKSLESQTFYDFIFSPHQDPFDSLYRCLLTEEKDYSFSKSEVEVALEAKADTLTKVISTLKNEEERWLIFVDQFEELFTNCDDADKRKNFISGLVQVAKSGNSSVKIVLAMRSDFLEQFSFYPDLGVIANQNNIHLVTEMYPDELRQAIEQPVLKHGVVFEEGLVEQIIKEVEGQKGYLPLLQYTLDLLWESECKTLVDGRPSIENRVLNKKSYTALEGVRGALQKRINQIYQNLSQDDQIVTKQVFVRLVTIVDTDLGNKAVSRRAYRNEFKEKSVENILNKFINENILVSNSDYISDEKLLLNNSQNQKQAATVEIAHEILLTSWDTLKRWIEEGKEVIILKSWLASEAKRWQRIRRGNESKAKDELLKGSRLNQIVEWKNKDAFKNLGGLTAEEKQFIDASLAWQNQIIQREKRQIFILRSLLFGTTIALVLAISTSVYAFTQATIAGLGEQAAKARLEKSPLNWLVKAVKLTGESQDKLKEVLESVRSTLFDSLQKPVERNILRGHKQNITSVTFSPDGNYIASSSEDNTVRLWDLDGYPVGKPFRGHEDYVNAVNFSPDGRYIVTGSSDTTVRLWDLHGNSIGTPFKGHQGVVRSVAFSPDSQYIISSGDDGMRLWDLKGNVIQPFLKLKGRQIKSVAFSLDGQTIVIASDTLQFWDRKGNSIAKPIQAHVYGVSSLAISPDGKYIVTSGGDGTVNLIDFQKKTILPTPAKDTYINSVAFSPDSKFIAITDGNTVRVRDLKGNLIGQPFSGHDDKVTSVAFSPLGKDYIVTGSWDKTVRLWNFGTLNEKVSNSEDYKASLKLACNRLLFHSVIVKGETEEARDASKTCRKSAWENIETAQFLVNQGKAMARQGNLVKAVDSFKQAQKLNSNLRIHPEADAKAQQLAAMASIDSEEQNNTEVATSTLPNHATYGQVKLTDFTLNNKSNVISVAPGEKINGSGNYIYDCPECQSGSINQIIIGLAGQNSAQACIYNGFIQGKGSNKFMLTAPSEPGTYYIRFRYAQAYGCEQGALGWWRVGNEPTAEANIGAIIIRQGKQP